MIKGLELPFCCPDCNVKRASKQDLKRHIHRYHPETTAAETFQLRCQAGDRIHAMTVEVMDNMKPTRPQRFSICGQELSVKEIDYATEQLHQLQMAASIPEVARSLCTRLLAPAIRNTLPGGLSMARLG